MANLHAIVIPYPVQGHVIAHMELSHQLVKHGFRITFVNSEFNHNRVMTALQNHNKEGQIHLVSISDGLAQEDDRNDLVKISDAMIHVLPGKLEELIKKINESDKEKEITCVISDMGWVLEVAEKMGIKQRAAFWTVPAGIMAPICNIPKLIDQGIINPDGTLIKHEMIQLSPMMPAMNTAHFVWLCIGDLSTQKIMFETIVRSIEAVKAANWHICNSSNELEPEAFALVPHILPIGPLLASSKLEQSVGHGHFWPEDLTCLNWLDQQPARSVVYVAFGSFTIFDHTQFEELALGLELSNRPFLWVVRPDIINESSNAYPSGFQTRVVTHGKIVEWAPQQKVLSHPSIACFLTHCGWNSTVEGVSNGVPFLCWPYFADQFLNQSYICDVWKVGLGLNPNGNGIISKEEIKIKVEQLLGNDEIRTKISQVKEMVRKSIMKGGSSSKNFDTFVEGITK